MTSNEECGRTLARAARRAAHVSESEPIGDMFRFVRDAAHIDVVTLDASEEEHGLSMRDPKTGKVYIAVAMTRHPMRQRSSIGHELGHVLAGDLERTQSLTTGERSPEEIRADAFARHLLLPLSAIHARQLGRSVTETDVSNLVREYRVSPTIAAIQLRDAGVIDMDACLRWKSTSSAQLAARCGWLGQYTAQAAESQVERAPERLMARAIEGYRRGVIGLNEVALWYGKPPEDLRGELGEPLTAPSNQADDWGIDEPLFDEEIRP